MSPHTPRTQMFRVTNTDNKENTVIIQGAFAQNSNVDVASLIFQNYDHDTQQRYDLAEVAVRDAYGSASSNGYGRFIVRVSSNERLSIKDDKEFSVIQPGVFEIKSGTDSNAVLKVYPTVTNESNATLELLGSMSITGHLVPTACNRYDLGASNFPFRDAYFSGNTITLGNTMIGTDPDGGVVFKDRLNPTSYKKIVTAEIQLGTANQNVRIVNTDNRVNFVTTTDGAASSNPTDISTGNLTVSGDTTLGDSSNDTVTINSTLNALHGLSVTGTVSATAFSGSGAALTGLDTTVLGTRSINTSNYVYGTLDSNINTTSNIAYQANTSVTAAINTANAASNTAYATSNYSYGLVSSDRPANAIPYWNASSNQLQFDDTVVIKDGILGVGTLNPSLGVLQIGGFMYITASSNSLGDLTYDGSQIVPEATVISNTATNTSNYAYGTLTSQVAATSNVAYATSNVAYAALPATGGTLSGNLAVTGTVSSGTGMLFRNTIINGDFRINQRGTSTNLNSLTEVGASTGYVGDRWGIFRDSYVTGAVMAQGDNLGASDLPYTNQGIRNFGRVGRASGNTGTQGIYLGYALESRDSYPLAGKHVTVSFYYRTGANFSGSSLRLRVSTGTDVNQGYQRGTNITNHVFHTNDYAPSSNWVAAVFTTPALNTNISQVGLFFQYLPTSTAGANDWFDVTGIQLEKGTLATPFEVRPFALEIQLCQWYYEKSYNIEDKPGTVTVSGANMNAPEFRTIGSTYNPCILPYKVTKRTIPTVLIYNPSTGTLNSVYNSSTTYSINLSIVYTTTNGILNITLVSAPSNNNGITFHFTADAEL